MSFTSAQNIAAHTLTKEILRVNGAAELVIDAVSMAIITLVSEFVELADQIGLRAPVVFNIIPPPPP